MNRSISEPMPRAQRHRAGAAEIGQWIERLGARARRHRFRRGRLVRFGRNDMNADQTGLAHEIVHDRAVQHLEPSRAVGFADDDLGDVVRLGVGDDLVGDVAARDRDRRSAEPLGEPQVSAIRSRSASLSRWVRAVST